MATRSAASRVGEPETEMMAAVESAVPYLPADRPRYAMGLGTPPQMIEMVARGVDLFDCVLPTRIARNGTAFTSRRHHQSKKRGVSLSMRSRSSATGSFPAVCPSRRGYLRHLVKAEEILGLRLDHAAQPILLSRADAPRAVVRSKREFRRVSPRVCRKLSQARSGGIKDHCAMPAPAPFQPDFCRTRRPLAGGHQGRALSPCSPRSMATSRACARVAGARRWLHHLRGESAQLRKDPARSPQTPRWSSATSTKSTIRCASPGVAEVLTDARVARGDLGRAIRCSASYLGSPENPELIIYCIRPERVRFMREWALEYWEVDAESEARAYPRLALRAGAALNCAATAALHASSENHHRPYSHVCLRRHAPQGAQDQPRPALVRHLRRDRRRAGSGPLVLPRRRRARARSPRASRPTT